MSVTVCVPAAEQPLSSSTTKLYVPFINPVKLSLVPNEVPLSILYVYPGVPPEALIVISPLGSVHVEGISIEVKATCVGSLTVWSDVIKQPLSSVTCTVKVLAQIPLIVPLVLTVRSEEHTSEL